MVDLGLVVEHLPVKVVIIQSSLHVRCICSLGYFLSQPVVYDWSIKGCGMCCPFYGKLHIKDPLLFIGKSSLNGKSRFLQRKCVTMTICLTSNSQWYANQCVLEASFNKINFPLVTGTYMQHQDPQELQLPSLLPSNAVVLAWPEIICSLGHRHHGMYVYIYIYIFCLCLVALFFPVPSMEKKKKATQ